MPKRSLRKDMLLKRSSLDPYSVASAEKEMVSRVFEIDIIHNAVLIALYASVKNEMRTDLLFDMIRSSGKEVCYPAVSGDFLLFRKVESRNSLAEGAFGIPEPDVSLVQAYISEIDVVIMPGIAFDLNGHRVGYGKGYYDRTLAGKGVNSRLVGICHDFQLLDSVPSYDHDIRMHYVVTEHRTVCCSCD